MPLYIGIDPGLKGAAVAITEQGVLAGCCPATWERRSLSRDVHDWLDGLGAVDAVAIEAPVMMFRNGHAIHKSTTAVAMSVGQWTGMLAAVGIRGVRSCQPRSWQSVILGSFEKGESKVAAIRWATMKHGAPMEELIRANGDGCADAAGLAEWVRIQVAAERAKDRALVAEARRA